MSTHLVQNTSAQALSESSVRTTVSMLVNIVETACEHEADLELMRLVNFMDLYRMYLECSLEQSDKGGMVEAASDQLGAGLESPLDLSECVNFEHFISDSRLLRFAAEAASRDCGVAVATPAPLKLSANGSHG